MFIAYTVVAVLLAAVLTGSAAATWTRNPHVIESLQAVQVPASWYSPLATLNLASALGLLAGIARRPIGVAAAIGIGLFFLGAIISHLRVHDTEGITAPIALTFAAVAPLALGLGTL